MTMTGLAVFGWSCGSANVLGEPCESSRECTAGGLVCDTVAGVCVECLAEVDCLGENEVCIARTCRPAVECDSSRQCPGQVCDTARRLCVDCVTAVDCSETERCEGGGCVTAPTSCSSDRECSSDGNVCDVEQSICVKCVRAADCDEGEECTADRRCARTSTQCVPGSVECASDASVRRCGADGRWMGSQDCFFNQTCSGGVCSDSSCNPACGPGSVCVDSACTELTCSPGCTGDEACVSGVCQCGIAPRCDAGTVCQGGFCAPTSCDPACEVGEQCIDGECQCGEGAACAAGQVCEGGACRVPGCAPTCASGEACVGDSCRCGSGPSCGADQQCRDGSCAPIACSPSCAASERCVGGSCRCGSGPACSGAQQCIGGSCTTSTACSESPCRLVSPQCGCAAGQSCDVRSSVQACFAAGTGTEGQPCANDTNPCAPGLTCTGSPGYCVYYCRTDSDCPSGGGSICGLKRVNDDGITLAKMCGIDCDPVHNTGCRSDTTCEIASVREGTREAVTRCIGFTEAFPLPICLPGSCPSGQFCFDVSTCKKYCRIGMRSDCPSPQVCTTLAARPQIDGTEYGYCH